MSENYEKQIRILDYLSNLSRGGEDCFQWYEAGYDFYAPIVFGKENLVLVEKFLESLLDTLPIR